MSDVLPGNAEHVSRALFGRSMRLPILMWIRARGDPAFYQGEVHAATGYPQSAVAGELARFADVGLICRQGRVSHGRQYYVRDDDSALWTIVDAACGALTDDGEPSTDLLL